MGKQKTTQSGPVVIDGIEYNEYPPPERLIKATESKWAVELMKRGLLRLHKLEYYQKWENQQLGDSNEGIGLYHLDGHPIETGSLNDVYVWCASLPVIAPERISLIAQYGNYDSIIKVSGPEELFKRVKNYLSIQMKGFWLHCGRVNYDRGTAVDKKELNSQRFHFNVFQKALKLKEDMEYRISVINFTSSPLFGDNLDLLLGDCSDIVTMEALPSKRMEPSP